MSDLAQANTDNGQEDKKLQSIFLEGWTIYDELEELSSLPSNSLEFQTKVKASMSQFESATRLVNQIQMFSTNELIDEVSTESLQYMLLPFFLGKVALKLNREDRLEVLNIAEIYFNDYLQRCHEYELCDAPKKDLPENKNATGDNNASSEIAHLLRAAHARNDKIAQFRKKKELEEQIKNLKSAVQSNSIDEEIKRKFFLNLLEKSTIDAKEELDSISLEKQVLEMRKMRMGSGSGSASTSYETMQSLVSHQSHSDHSRGHGHSHAHAHTVTQPKPKPLQPFIITRNAAQKAVFGMGYPSLPVMTVDEFYQQRVDEGIFPNEEKVAQMNQAQAVAAAQNPNEKEDQENAAIEEQVENDDPEYIARMRRMDEYKDVVRRGDGNRYNRS